MDFTQPRKIFSEHFLHQDVSIITQFNLSAFNLKTLLKAPQVISNRGSILLGKIPGSAYISRAIREARDPKTAKCLRYDQVDECLREHGIIYGYRNENCSVSQAFMSLFRVTNETINFWTHFLPSVYFIWILFYFCQSYPLFSDAYYLPLFCYMITSCAYPLMSSIAHAFCCLSIMATHVCFFMDYATLAIYSWGAGMLYYNYAFPQEMLHTTYAYIFLPVAAILVPLTSFMACYSRFISSTSVSCKLLRLGAFVIPYIWVSIPLVWRLLLSEHSNDNDLSFVNHTRQFIGVLLASFFYASHIPERFIPGRFDFIGNSHNLLHVFGVAATYEQMKGGLLDLENRRELLQSLNWGSSPVWVTIISPLILLTTVIIILSFTKQIKNDDLDKKVN